MAIPSMPQDVATEHSFDTPLSVAVASRDTDVLSLVSRALAEGRAQLAFQPVVVADDPARIAFYEGLIRVTDTGDRVIPASHFMPIIEETALGRQMDAVTLDLAIRLLERQADLRLSINVSARSLGDGVWRRTLEAGLSRSGSLGDRLILEISETSAMMLHEVVVRFMEEMQPRGVCFALDSFGGGMIAFRHLKDFFFDLVKVDKSFVRGIADEPDNQVLVKALITVAHQFEMVAVVEGVETKEDAAFLNGIGADCLQCWHYGQPSFELS